MTRVVAAALVLVVVVSGCGGGTTETVTETVTVTEVTTTTAASSSDDAATGEEFCTSPTADALQVADTRANAAFQGQDRAAFVRQTEELLRLAKNAPAGAWCAVQALDNTANLWAANMFPDSDAYLVRIRRFQQDNDLRRAAN